MMPGDRSLYWVLPFLLAGLLAGASISDAITFTQHTVSDGFTAGRDVCVADINGDGRLDVVGGGGYEVSWWENLPGCGFVEHLITDQVSIARSVRAADIDGDGWPDVVAAVWQQNQILWWKNDGQGGFTEHALAEPLVGPHTVDVKDLDGDGLMDILCSGFDMSSAFSEIAWWQNTGGGSFAKHVISERFQQSPFIFGERIDDDDHMDVLACGELNNEVVWWRSEDDTTFTAQVIDSTFNAAHTVLARDLDQDGDMDVLGAACMSSRFTWWENDGEQRFQRHDIAILAGALWIDAADLDGDGDNDLIAAGMGDPNISWWENDGQQGFTKHLVPGSLAEAYSVVCGFMDNDQDYDLVAIGKSSNTVSWYENSLLTPAEDSPPAGGGALRLESFPNPAPAVAFVRVCLPRSAAFTVSVYDARGRAVRTLATGSASAGEHVLRWDGTGHAGTALASGLYFYRVEAGGATAAAPMLLIR